MPPITILFADNHADFLETRAEYLTNAGYEVIRAYSLSQAEEGLRELHPQLAILDVRLVDDNDEKDTSGLQLVKARQFQSIPKIILTYFPTYTDAREALLQDSAGVSPALDYIPKVDGAAAMLSVVERTLARFVKINPMLRFRWRMGPGLRSFLTMALWLGEDEELPHLFKRAGELESLFCSAFYDADQITFNRLIWSRTGQMALEVVSHNQLVEHTHLVTCQKRVENPDSSSSIWQAIARNIHPPGAHIEHTAESVHYVAHVWEAPDVFPLEMRPLSTFYHQNEPGVVRYIFENLIQFTLAPWYTPIAPVRSARSLRQLAYQQLSISADALREKIISIACLAEDFRMEITPGVTRLHIRLGKGINLNLPNPAHYIEHPSFPAIRVDDHLSPADLAQASVTILAAADGRTWLTDVHDPSPVPASWDLAVLETLIRFDWLPPEDVIDFYEIENSWLSADPTEELPCEMLSASRRKAAVVIALLRQSALDLCGGSALAYDCNLLLNSLDVIANYEPTEALTEREKYCLVQHLIFSAMLCHKTEGDTDGLVAVTAPAHLPGKRLPPLVLDQTNCEAVLGEKRVNLSNREYDLLAFLYQHAGNLCPRKDIMLQVFHIPNPTRDDEVNLLNSAIDRLRDRIEPLSTEPCYIVTVRGRGYKLITDPDIILP